MGSIQRGGDANVSLSSNPFSGNQASPGFNQAHFGAQPAFGSLLPQHQGLLGASPIAYSNTGAPPAFVASQ